VPSHAVLVAFDDVDLPFGTLRMRPFGGSGGHNGMKSIIQSLGTEEFPRLRIGVNRPPGRLEAADYVLQDFSAAESAELPAILERGVQAALLFFSQGLDFAMTTCNTEK